MSASYGYELTIRAIKMLKLRVIRKILEPFY